MGDYILRDAIRGSLSDWFFGLFEKKAEPSREVYTDQAPMPQGHYPQARVFGDTMRISGQVPVNVGDEKNAAHVGNIDAQTILVISHIEAICAAENRELGDVEETTVYLAQIETFPAMDAAYARAFGDHKPVRALVPTEGLGKKGYGLEIKAIVRMR